VSTKDTRPTSSVIGRVVNPPLRPSYGSTDAAAKYPPPDQGETQQNAPPPTAAANLESMNTNVTIIDPLRTALAGAVDIPELQQVHDMAIAAQAWAKARGMGITAENQAAEYILRAERGMGILLSALDMKRGAQPGNRHHVAKGDDVYIPGGPLDRLIEEGVLRNKKQSWEFQLAAAIPEDTFERMLREMHANVERIAKVNFYRAGRQARGGVKSKPSTPEDEGFTSLRAGAYALLGWSVNQQGEGGPTRNGFTQLPDDQLQQFAELVPALVRAYGEARAARG